MNTPKKTLACQLHPATDLWMQGDRYGTVLRSTNVRAPLGDERYRVRMDKSNRVVTVHVRNIVEFFER